jgi:hypothetical protein
LWGASLVSVPVSAIRDIFIAFYEKYLVMNAPLQSPTPPTMPPKTKGKKEAETQVEEGRPTVADLQGEHPFAQLAKTHWLKSSKKKVKVKGDVLKLEIWDVLEQEGFAFKSLLLLENLRILEKYGVFLSA